MVRLLALILGMGVSPSEGIDSVLSAFISLQPTRRFAADWITALAELIVFTAPPES